MRRSLDIGAVFNGVFDLYRRYAGPLLIGAAVVFVLVGLAQALLRAADNSVILALVGLAITTIGSIWYQGMVVELVREASQGREPETSVGQLFASVAPRLGILIVAGILAGIGIAIGFVLIIVPGLVLLTFWALIAPVIVVERDAGVFEAFSRSWRYVRGNAWQVFAVIVAIFIFAFVVTAVLQTIFGAIAGFDWWGIWIGGVIGQVMVAPLAGLAASIIYFEIVGLRERAAAGVEASPGPPSPPPPPPPPPSRQASDPPPPPPPPPR